MRKKDTISFGGLGVQLGGIWVFLGGVFFIWGVSEGSELIWVFWGVVVTLYMTPTCRPCTYVCRFCSFVCRPRELKQGILLLKSCIFPDLGGKIAPPPELFFETVT